MKSIMVRGFLVFALLAAVTSCRDKDTEKRIAELESQIADLKGQKTAAPAKLEPVAAATPAAATATKPEGPYAIVAFAKTEHDFGTITEGQTVEYTYSLKNTGTAPLVIQEAKPSCGCTVPDWTKTPIPPGGSGFVKAKFDSNGKPGVQNKTITVMSNSYPKTSILKFKAMVTPKAGADTGPVK